MSACFGTLVWFLQIRCVQICALEQNDKLWRAAMSKTRDEEEGEKEVNTENSTVN